jgi:hypothetical protein
MQSSRAIRHPFQQQQIQQPIRFSKALLDYAICMIIGLLYGYFKGGKCTNENELLLLYYEASHVLVVLRKALLWF